MAIQPEALHHVPVKINGETEQSDFLVTELEPRLGDRLTTTVGWRISQGGLSVNVMASSYKNTLLMASADGSSSTGEASELRDRLSKIVDGLKAQT